MVVGAANAVDAGPRRAGTGVGGRVVVVRVGKSARRRPRGVGMSPRGRRALVSRLHDGGLAVVGESRHAQLEFLGLGSGGRGQGIATRGERRRDAAGLGMSVSSGPTQTTGGRLRR